MPRPALQPLRSRHDRDALRLFSISSLMSLGSSSGCRVFEPWIPNLVAGSEGDKIRLRVALETGLSKLGSKLWGR
jgi:hypothetical protein